MGAASSGLPATNYFFIDSVKILSSGEVTQIYFKNDRVVVKPTTGNVEQTFDRKNFEEPQLDSPTHWKSVQAVARSSGASIKRMLSRKSPNTLTIDWAPDLAATFTFGSRSTREQKLAMINAGSYSEALRIAAARAHFSKQPSSPGCVSFIEPTLVANAPGGVKYYEWTWKYVTPSSVSNPGESGPHLPPTNGHKTCLVFGEYSHDSFKAFNCLEFFISRTPPPTRQNSTYISGKSPAPTVSERRRDSHTEPPPSLTSHLQAETPDSPRSMSSSPFTPTTLLSSLSFLTGGAGQHRRETSTGTGSSATNLDEVDDDPSFRVTIDMLEKKTDSLKDSVKSCNKAVEHYIKAAVAFAEAGRQVVGSFGDFPGVDEQLLEVISEVQREICARTDILQNQLLGTVVEPVSRIYQTIKQADRNKRAYEQEAKEFQNAEQKYLSTKSNDPQKLSEMDKNWQERKKNFELHRFEYFCQLRDLHGAHMERDMNFHFNMFAEKQAQWVNSLARHTNPQTANLSIIESRWKESAEKYNEERREREERRKLIEFKALHSVENALGERVDSDEDLGSWAAPGRRRKGYLFTACLNPGEKKLGLTWKRSWCVVTGGVLQESSIKKKTPQSTNTLGLKLCTVRESMIKDRRFVFEIITPSGQRRLYQATDAEDMRNWVVTIQNAIAGQINGTQTIMDGREETTRSLMTPLRKLQAVDASNHFCADCNSPKPDWASINLGCLICIQCAGIHRSLGTHISKVRALELDTESWTPELIETFSSSSNRDFNAIWEGELPNGVKPNPRDAMSVKDTYIKRKYTQKEYFARPADEGYPFELLDDVKSKERTSKSTTDEILPSLPPLPTMFSLQELVGTNAGEHL
ncbi:hypothetical protein HDU85_003773 [Gaertneriomyces sp. JEL0708]|nr:hypothetical protein HDU85_003773 [Gaertneriomyces sp. JEL0708]